MSTYTSNGSYLLHKLVLTTKNSQNSKVAWDLSKSFAECSLFESITDATMSGYIAVMDNVNLNNKLKLYGGEQIEIEFQTAGADENIISYIGEVYKISNLIRINENSMGYKISFVSREFINSERTYVQSAFENENSSIIKDIYNNKLLIDIEDEKELEVEDTISINKYVFGTVKPITAINIVAKDSVSLTDDVNYLFYEDNKKFNFKSLTGLYKQEPVAKYANKPAGVYDDVKQRVQEQFITIQDIQYKFDNSLLDRMSQGLHGSNHYYFDLTTKEFVNHHYNIDNNYSVEHSLGELPTKREIKDGEFVSYLGYVSDNMAITPYYVESMMESARSETFKASILIFGDSKLKAGDVLEVHLPRLTIDEESVSEYEGKVLISAIRHTFDAMSYMQEIEIIKDSYMDVN